jgi:hypothetical protein
VKAAVYARPAMGQEIQVAGASRLARMEHASRHRGYVYFQPTHLLDAKAMSVESVGHAARMSVALAARSSYGEAEKALEVYLAATSSSSSPAPLQS